MLVLAILMLFLQTSAVGQVPAGGTDPGALPENSVVRTHSVGAGGGGCLIYPRINPQDANNLFIGCDMFCNFISNDGGKSFHTQNMWRPAFGTPRWAFNPHNANIVYGFAGDTIFVSDDKGVTWRNLYPKPEHIDRIGHYSGNQAARIFYKPGTNFFSGYPGWTNSAWYADLLVHPSTPTTLYTLTGGISAGVAGGPAKPMVFKSTDGGETWSLFATLMNETGTTPLVSHIGSVTAINGLSSIINRSFNAYGRMLLHTDGNLYVITNRGFSIFDANGAELYKKNELNRDGQFGIEGGKVVVYFSIATEVIKGTNFGAGNESWASITTTLQSTAQTPRGKKIQQAAPIQFYQLGVSGNTVYVQHGYTSSASGHTDCRGISKTIDGGKTWQWVLDTAQGTPQGSVSNVSPLGPMTSAATGSTTLAGYCGASEGINVNPVDPNHVLITGMIDAYQTFDGGATWTSLASRSITGKSSNTRPSANYWQTKGIEPAGQNAFAVNPNNPHHHLTGWVDVGYHETLDAGESWTRVVPPGSQANAHAIAFDPFGSGVVLYGSSRHQYPSPIGHGYERVEKWLEYVNTNNQGNLPGYNVGRISKSINNGLNWERSTAALNATTNPTPIVLSPTGAFDRFGTSAMTFASERLHINNIIFDPNRRGVVYLSSYGLGVLKSADYGNNWEFCNNGITLQSVASGNNTLYGILARRMTLSKDGKTLLLILNSKNNTERNNSASPLLYQLDLTNNSASWVPIPRPMDRTFTSILHNVEKDRNGVLYAAMVIGSGTAKPVPGISGATHTTSCGGAFMSENNGATWTQIFDDSLEVRDIKSSSRNSNLLYLTTASARIYVSGRGKNTTLEDWIEVTDASVIQFALLNNIYEDPNDTNRFYVTTICGGTWNIPSPIRLIPPVRQ